MNASVPARFDCEPQECVFGAGFRPSNLGIEWNAENQLKKVLKNAATIATFAYDPFGRRVEKVAGGTTTTFTYDREDILREIAGATTTYYVHGPGIDEPLAKEISGSSTYYHADALGSLLKKTSAAGSVTHEYRYDAYGRVEAGSTQGGYAYTGREWDPETKLYNYRARYYDPEIGRFVSADGLGFAAGDANLYSYVFNDPANLTDPTGLWAGVDDLVFAGAGALVGVAGQGISDLISGNMSGWERYAAAAVGGAAGGEALLYTANPFIAGAVGGAVTNLSAQGLELVTGTRDCFSWQSLATDTGVGTLTGFIPGTGKLLPGVTAGRGSFIAVANQMHTKLMNGTINSVSTRTAVKMMVGQFLDKGMLPGAGAAAVAGVGLSGLLN